MTHNLRPKDLRHETEVKRRMRAPDANSWLIVAAGAVVPCGVAAAAAVTCYVSKSERVAMTAWIATAVIGTAAIISSSVTARRKSVVTRDEVDPVSSSEWERFSEDRSSISGVPTPTESPAEPAQRF